MMKTESKLKKIRNITVFSDNDKLRTILVDKILSYMGYEDYYKDSQASMDWMECERDIDAVIINPVTTESWLGTEVNLIRFDSLFELHTLRVVDGGISLLSATSKVELITVELYKMRIKYHIPSLIFMGQIAKKGADFFARIKEIESKLDTVPLVMQLPIGEDYKFEGLIDLITMRELIWHEVNDIYTAYNRDKPTEHEIRKELMPKAIAYREKMIEQLAQVDGNEKLMEKFLEDRAISQEEIIQAIRVATLSMGVIPILLGCVSHNKGIKKLLDAVVAYLPSPSLSVEAQNIENHQKIRLYADENEPFVGVVFATEIDPFVGEFSVVRIYQGSLTSYSSIHNITQNRAEQIKRMFKLYAIKREEVHKVVAGDMVNLTGLKAEIGDTLCEPNYQVQLEKVKDIEPLFLVKVYVNPTLNRDISYIIEKIARENPLCKISCDEYISIYGDSKFQLEQIVSRLREHYHLDIQSDKPQIIYYRTIKTLLEKEYIYREKKKYAHIALKLEPQEQGEGYKLIDGTKGGVVPKEFIYPIYLGIKEALEEGIADGYPIVDIKATLYGGSYRDASLTAELFTKAGYHATKEALREAEFVLFEPIMKLNIKADEKFRRAILADITKRRGIACGKGGDKHNLGDIYVPLAEIVDYSDELYELTDGQASFEMKLERYEVVPEYLENRREKN